MPCTRTFTGHSGPCLTTISCGRTHHCENPVSRILAKCVKTYPEITVPQHSNDFETNGIAERALRIKEGTFAVLWQSSLDEKMVGCFHGMHVQDPLADGRTPFERFGPFRGPIIPFNSMISSCAKDQSLHQFGDSLHGMFLGYASFSGRI